MVYGIILSGGTGVRAGGNIPKQYYEVDGKPVIAECLDIFEKDSQVDKYVIVAAIEWNDYIDKYTGEKFIGFASAGENRQMSIYNGLQSISKFAHEDDIVIIHDAARPFVTGEMIDALVSACTEADGAMPALAVKDTMYIQENGKVKALINRDSLIAGQAPEAFKYGLYVRSNEDLLPDKILEIKGSTEPAFLAGMNIAVINGDESNFKITTKEDLEKYIQIKKR